jgi:hypothetical protein
MLAEIERGVVRLSVKEKMREGVARLYLRRRRNSRKKELSVGFTGGTNEGRMSRGENDLRK